MIDTSKLTQPEFIRIHLDRDTRNIFKAQLLSLSKPMRLDAETLRIHKRRKTLNRDITEAEKQLRNPSYFMKSQGENFIVQASIPIDLRFWDMRRKQNMHIYNKIVWGILYNNAYPDIRFMYGKEIRNAVGEALDKAFEQSK